MPARGYLILIKRDGSDGSVYPVTTSSCSVGRSVSNDIRVCLPSVAEDQCAISTSEFKPAVLENLSNSNPTEINNVPVYENKHTLRHGDRITTGERSFRWEYHPQSQYYIPTKGKDTRQLSASPLSGSIGMVGMPVSVLQSTLGSRPFSRQSVVVAETKVKLSPSHIEADTQVSPSKLVAVVNPQIRPQSENYMAMKPVVFIERDYLGSSQSAKTFAVQAAEVSNLRSPARTSVKESRNRSSAKNMNKTQSNRKSNILNSKSAKKSTESDDGMKMLLRKQSCQALVTPRNTRKSAVGTPRQSRIPKLKYNLKRSGAPQSSKKSGNSSGSFKKMTPVSSLRKTKSEQKQPLASAAYESKRKHESGLRSAETAAKKLKLESPKTPDRKKMAALLVCHRKVSRPKTPQNVSNVPHELTDTSAVKSVKPMTALSASRIAARKTARKQYENIQTSVGDEMLSSKRAYSMEIPTAFSFSSGTVPMNVASGEKHEVKDNPVRLSCNSRRSCSCKTEQTVSPGPKVADGLHGVKECISSLKITSRRKTASPTSVNAIHTPAAVHPTGRHSHSVSTDHTHDGHITLTSGKKIYKRNVPESLLKQLMYKSVQSTSPFIIEDIKDAKTSETLLITPDTRRKTRSMSASCPVTTVQTNGMYSSRKSSKASVQPSPESGPNSPHTRKFSSSPKIEQKERLITHSSTPGDKKPTSRKNLRFSRLGVQSSESVESSPRSPQTEGKGRSVAPSTYTSNPTASIRKSRTSLVTQALNSDKSDSGSPLKTECKGKPLSSSTPAYKQTASTVKSGHAEVVGLSPKSLEQNSTSVGLRTLARLQAPKDYKVVPISGPFMLKPASSQRISSSFEYLSSELDKEGPHSSGLDSELPDVPKSSRKRVHKLSSSQASLNSSPEMSVLTQESDISHKRSSLKDQVSQTKAYHTHLTSPGSQNTTFDFDSVKTPYITLENIVSPLFSSRKQNSFRWQDVRTSKQKRNSEPAFKRQHVSEKIVRNVTFSEGSSVHSLPSHYLLTPLIYECVDTYRAEGKECRAYENSLPDRLAVPAGEKITTTPRTDSVDVAIFTRDERSAKSLKRNVIDVCGVEQLMKTPRDLQSRDDLRNVSGVKVLMKTPDSPNFPKNDLGDVLGARQLMKTPRSPKSPMNDLRDVHGVRQLMKTPKSPKSPKNDLRDVRGVRQLMKTPKSPESPKNDLRDVCGLRQLMKTPKCPKSPKNDLRDVHGVRRLMKTPKSPESPKNDLRDVCGVRQLMRTPESPKSPKDLRDVRGVKQLMKTPISQKSPTDMKSPLNDLADIHGVRRLTTTPQVTKSPENDLTGVAVKDYMKTRGTHARRTKFINEVPEGDISTEMNIDQKTASVPQDIKRTNTRNMRSRREPDLCTVQGDIAEINHKPPLKPRQKKKTESSEGLSPGRNLEILPGSTVSSVVSREVHWNVPDSPTPGGRVMRRKNHATSAEVELPTLPPRTRKTVRSKGSQMVEDSAAQEDTNDLAVSVLSIRKTRSRQLTSAVEISSLPPTIRRQGAGDVEISSVPKQKQDIGATVKVEPPLSSKRQQGDTATISVEELSPPRKRRGGTVNTVSEQSSPPKRLRVTVTEDVGATVTSSELTSRRLRGAAAVSEVEILHSPVIKKTKGKLAVRAAVARTASTVPSEELFSVSDKQSATEESASPDKRRKRGMKLVEAASAVPTRKLRGIKLSDAQEENVSSRPRTRNKKPKVTSSPLLKAELPPAVTKRGRKNTAKKEVSSQGTTERQTRATNRRKK